MERVVALADLDPAWVQRSWNASLYEGKPMIVRVRVDGATGPGTEENALFLVTRLGDRSGSQGADGDRDGLSDEVELAIGSDPDAFDSDGDTIPDGFELYGTLTRPELADSDGDGTPDNVELDIDDVSIYSDDDGDGFLNGQEVASFNTNPNAIDSDGDGFGDDFEYFFCTEMNDPAHPDTDSDDDGQPDLFEMANGFDPHDESSHVADNDGDALPDFADYDDDSAWAAVPGHGDAVPAGPAHCVTGSIGGQNA